MMLSRKNVSAAQQRGCINDNVNESPRRAIAMWYSQIIRSSIDINGYRHSGSRLSLAQCPNRSITQVCLALRLIRQRACPYCERLVMLVETGILSEKNHRDAILNLAENGAGLLLRFGRWRAEFIVLCLSDVVTMLSLSWPAVNMAWKPAKMSDLSAPARG